MQFVKHRRRGSSHCELFLVVGVYSGKLSVVPFSISSAKMRLLHLILFIAAFQAIHSLMPFARTQKSHLQSNAFAYSCDSITPGQQPPK
jgi:hypothetical protein